MISYQELRDRYAEVSKTLESLSPLVLDWADKRRLLNPIRRSLNTYLERAGADDEQWSDEVLSTLAMLSLFSRPPLLARITAEEATLERSLTGAEHQILNNARYHEPWSFRLYWLVECLDDGTYLAREAGTGEPAILVNPDLDDAVASGKELIGAVVVPAGSAEYRHGYGKASEFPDGEAANDGQSMDAALADSGAGSDDGGPDGAGTLDGSAEPDQGAENHQDHRHHSHPDQAPVYLLFGSFTAYNSFTEDDLAYLFLGMAKNRVRLPMETETVRRLATGHADAFLVLGLFGSRNEFTEDGEEPGTCCWSTAVLPEAAPVIRALSQNLLAQRNGDWQYFEGQYEEEQHIGSELVQAFFHEPSAQLSVRTTGFASYDLVWNIVNRATEDSRAILGDSDTSSSPALGGPEVDAPEPQTAPIEQMEPHQDKPAASSIGASSSNTDAARNGGLPRNPQQAIGLIALVAAQDLLNVPMPGPPKKVLDLFDLDW